MTEHLNSALQQLSDERRRLASLHADYATVTRSRVHALRMLWYSLRQLIAGRSAKDDYAVWPPPSFRPALAAQNDSAITAVHAPIRELLQMRLQESDARLGVLQTELKAQATALAQTMQQKDEYIATLDSTAGEIETMRARLAYERNLRRSLAAENTSSIIRLEESWTALAVRDVQLAEASKENAVYARVLAAARKRLQDLTESTGVKRESRVTNRHAAQSLLVTVLREVVLWKTLTLEQDALARQLSRSELALAAEKAEAGRLLFLHEDYTRKLGSAIQRIDELKARLDVEAAGRQAATEENRALQQRYSTALDQIHIRENALAELSDAYRSLENSLEHQHKRFVSRMSADISEFQHSIAEIQGSPFWKMKLVLIKWSALFRRR